MKVAADLVPLALFFIAYQYAGIFAAVLALMVAMPSALLALRLCGRQPSKMQKWTCAIVLVSGTLTLVLREPAFILAKPTIIYWSLAVFLLAALWLRKNPAQSLLAPMLSKRNVPACVWRAVAIQWAVVLLGLGALNWLLAATVSESSWVKFKTFGFPLLTLVLLVAQLLMLYRKTASKTSPTQ